MQIEMAFGKHGINLTLPPGPRFEVLRPRFAGAIPDVPTALASALDQPIGSVSLEQAAAGKKTAAILVCDITRPAPNRTTLPPVLERLHRAGIQPDGITILIATGLHRIATAEEVEIIVGPEIAARYRVVSHEARDRSAHRFLGHTRRNTPVWIDERFMAADLHLSLGFIEPHLMLGFSGGRKLVIPGVAGEQTIKTIHSPGFVREARSIEGSVEDNPVHHEFLEIARMARHDFILDVTLNASRQISGVFAGNPELAHAAGIQFLRESSTVDIEERFDAAITTAAGFPLDLTFYQSVKGVTGAAHVVKPGAPMLLVSECAEGMGSAEFARMVRNYAGADACLGQIKGQPVEVDQWQIEKLAMVEKHHPLFFYTPGVQPEELGALAAGFAPTLDQALAATLSKLPPHARIAVLPEGPYTFVQARSAELAAAL